VGQLSGREKRLKARGLRNLLENQVISPFCSRCRENGHVARDCRRVVGQSNIHQGASAGIINLSDYVAPLCAAQVLGQAFFYIPNRPSDAHAKERSTTAIVTGEGYSDCQAGGRVYKNLPEKMEMDC
jgi:hypothetical protein